jgi:hypothetical protein
LALCAAALVAVIGGPATGVGADSPTKVGWWTVRNPGTNSPIPTLVPVQPTAPDVPDGGLEVETTSSVVSYAALSFEHADQTKVERVTLKLADGAAQLPNSVVQACALAGDGTFEAANGAPVSEAPPYDCSVSAQGLADPTGTRVSFDPALFEHGTGVAFAIVGLSPSRLVFAKPDDTTFVVTAARTTTAPTPFGSTGRDDRIATGAPRPVISARPALATPTVPTAPNAPSGPSSQPVAAAARFPVTPPDDSTGPGGAVIGFLLIAAGAAGVTVRNRRALGPVA